VRQSIHQRVEDLKTLKRNKERGIILRPEDRRRAARLESENRALDNKSRRIFFEEVETAIAKDREHCEELTNMNIFEFGQEVKFQLTFILNAF
jgi:hypothetical protein